MLGLCTRAIIFQNQLFHLFFMAQNQVQISNQSPSYLLQLSLNPHFSFMQSLFQKEPSFLGTFIKWLTDQRRTDPQTGQQFPTYLPLLEEIVKFPHLFVNLLVKHPLTPDDIRALEAFARENQHTHSAASLRTEPISFI